jgi:hypothetical protein
MQRPRFVFRRVIAAAALAVVFALVPAAAVAAKTSPTSAPACMTPGLVVWLNTAGDGTAGSIYYTLEFTNLSGHACTLNGYPFIHAVSLSGGLLGHVASFDHTHTPVSVTLANGATRKATLRIVEAGNFPASTCHQVTAAGLQVYPPNQTRAKIVPFPFNACSHTGPLYLSVGPVT